MHTIDSANVERDVVIGPSLRMRAVFEFLRVVTESDSTVVIAEESINRYRLDAGTTRRAVPSGLGASA